MDHQQAGIDEAVSVGTSAASHLKVMKITAALSKTAAGASAGPFGAVIGAAIQNRHAISRVVLVREIKTTLPEG